MQRKVHGIHKPFLFCYFLYKEHQYKENVERYAHAHNLQIFGVSDKASDAEWMNRLTGLGADLLGTKKNYSTIVANSEKALSVIPQLGRQMEMRQISIEDVVEYNPLFDRHTWFSEDRDKFFAEFEKDENGTIERWTEPYVNANQSLKGKIFCILPELLRKCYLNIVKR